jgi:hypothetical protein
MKTLIQAKKSRSKKENKVEQTKSLKKPMEVFEQLEIIASNGVGFSLT